MKGILLAITLAAASVSPALADVHKHNAARVSFWLPDSWKVSGDEKTELKVIDPSKQVAMLFTMGNHKDMKAALAGIDAALSKVATDVKMGEPQESTLNGMPVTIVDGKGKAEGHRVELSVLVVHAPGDHFLTILGIEDAEHKHEHDAELEKFLSSISPSK